MAHERLRERDERRVGRVARGRLGRRLGRWALAASGDRGQDQVAAPVQQLWRQAADLLKAVPVSRRAAGELHERLVGQHGARRAVRAARLLLAPLDELARDRARRVAEPAEPGQLLVGAIGVALVAHVLERARLLARPFEPATLFQAPFELLAERQQEARVIARVLELLRRERAPVPLREALAAPQLHPQHLPDERLVALLVPEAEEACRHLRVEHVRDLGVPAAAKDRHVLAPCVHQHLDAGVGEDASERGEVELALERVEHLGTDFALGIRIRHGHLHQTEQRLVAAL